MQQRYTCPIAPTHIFLTVFLVYLFTASPVTAQSPADAAKIDVNRLTAADMYGRGYTNKGHLKAAEYIKQRFKELGLESRYSELHFQEFKLKVNRFDDAPVLTINGKTLSPGIDFLPYGLSGSGKAKTPKDTVLWVEHGLIVPEKKINDFAGKEIKDAVILMDGTIPEYIKSMRSLQGRDFSLESRVGNARVFEARGVIAIVDKLTFKPRQSSIGMPVLQVLRDQLPENPIDVKSLEYRVKSKVKRIKTNNVIGFLPARSDTEDLIILTAHYDHLGSLGSSVYFPGANDNASGVAMLLSLADYFRTHRLQTNILFVAFSGEELGLKGSNHFVRKLPFSADKVKFVLNFDMVASGESGVVAVGGTDFPDAYQQLVTFNEQLGLGPLKDRSNKAISDHYPFLERGIKGFYLYTKDGKQPYHHINDRAASLEWEDYMHVYELSKLFIGQWE